jgi:hypothetical protein
MRRLLLCLLPLALLWEPSLEAQAPPGTGMPRVGIPGGPPISFPRRTKKKKDEPVPPELLKTLNGVILLVEGKDLVLEGTDKRNFWITLGDRLEVTDDKGPLKESDLQPGDTVQVDATQGEDGKYFAVTIRRDKVATAAERARAQANRPTRPKYEEGGEEAKPEPARDPDGPPRYTRNKPEAPRPPAEPPAKEPLAAEPSEEPRNTRVVREAKELEEDPNKPRLARGKPRPRRTTDADTEAPVEVAAAGPTAPVREADNPLPPPGEVSRDDDPFLERTQKLIEPYLESFPNYLVKQFTTRFVSGKKKDDWQPLDNIQAEVLLEKGKESYRNVMLNGKPSKGKVEQSGAWSTGEFAVSLRAVFAGGTEFRPGVTATIANRKARTYRFSVKQEYSAWNLVSAGESYRPAFRGTVWIDVETGHVLRLEQQARGLPAQFPIDTAEIATDWEFVKLGGSEYVLPVHAESLICQRGSSCYRNTIDFRNYRRFGSESNITFTP